MHKRYASVTRALGAVFALMMLVTLPVRATGGPVQVPFTTVDGTSLSAWLDLPPGNAPRTLVVFCHGYQETKDVFLIHMQSLRGADTSQVLAMAAPDYRDDQGFPVLRGAQDTLALVKQLRQAYPSIQRTVLLGISMGGGVCGTAASEAGRSGATPIDALFSLEGVTLLEETYTEAKAIAALAPVLNVLVPGLAETFAQTASEIDRDIAAAPEPSGSRAAAFARRSPAMNGPNLFAAGIKGAAVVQGVFDGVVPDNESLALSYALKRVSIPAVTVQALLGQPGGSNGETIFTLLGLGQNLGGVLPLIGHGDSDDPSQPVIFQGMCRLKGFLAGTNPIRQRFVVVSYPIVTQSCSP